MIKKRYREIIGFLLIALFQVSLCYAQGVDIDDKENSTQNVGVDKCSDYRKVLEENIENGYLLTNKLWETVPYIGTSFKWKSTYVRVPMHVLDVNRDSEYELLYLVDIGFPMLDETKLYLVRNLPKDTALSLISYKYKSPFYKLVMDDLASNYVWDPMRDIIEGAYQIMLPDIFKRQQDIGDSLRLTLVDIENVIFLLVEGLKSKKVWLVKFNDSKSLEKTPDCSFVNLLD